MRVNNQYLNNKYVQSLLVFFSAQTFYLFTLAPTVLWGDQANYQRLAYTLDFQAPHTYAKHHLWVILANTFTKIPLGDVAFRVNLFTSVWASLAILFVFAFLRNLTKSWSASLIGAISLMVSHNFWIHAVRTEVYSFNLAMLAIGLYYFAHPQAGKKHYLAGSIAIALAVTNHSMMWLCVPAIGILIVGLYLERNINRSLLLSSLIGFSLSIILLQILLAPFATTSSVNFDLNNFVLNWRVLPTEIIKLGAYWLLQFPSPALIIMGVGIYNSKTRLPLAFCLIFIWAANIVSLVNVNFPDKYVFYMLSYFVGAIWVGLGAKTIIHWLASKTPMLEKRATYSLMLTLLLCPILAYHLAPQILPILGITSKQLGIREIPERPALTFFLSPSTRGYQGAHVFAQNVLTSLPQNATIIADYTVVQPMLYLQTIENVRPDVNIVDIKKRNQVEFVSNHPPEQPLFLALTKPYYDIEGISKHFSIVQEEFAYKLELLSSSEEK